MWNRSLLLCLTALILGLIITKFNINLREIAEENKCPFCYGDDFCTNLSVATLRKDDLSILFNNYFGVKDVYITVDNLVLKKGRNKHEILGNPVIDENALVDFASAKYKAEDSDFKICTGVDKFVLHILKQMPPDVDREIFLKQVFTMIVQNSESLVLQFFFRDDVWPVPKYVGACGLIFAEEYCGLNLNFIENNLWLDRAYVAVQLLKAAVLFTNGHEYFRFYLTDISPDNVVVDENLRISFVDLENVIVTDKGASGSSHQSTLIGVKDYSYSEREICNSTISDHNYFSICKLLLSKHTPWPMMEYGLLHTKPGNIKIRYPHLFQLIEECVTPKNLPRVQIVTSLITLLEEILKEYKFSHVKL